jgi:hypothetical protein
MNEAVCSMCNLGADDVGELHWGPDPFLAEIYDDYTPCWLCESCANERYMEI